MLAAHGHAALLELPPAVFRPELEPFMAAVFRHILEDPVTLQVGGSCLPLHTFSLYGLQLLLIQAACSRIADARQPATPHYTNH